MEHTSNNNSVLINKLIEINNDRIEGYETAITLLPDKETSGARKIFEALRDQSLAFKNELAPLVVQCGGKPTETTRDSGKLFRAWMTLKSTLSAHTLASILDSCDQGEQEFSEAYFHALEDSIGAGLDIVTIIERQSNLQQETYNKLKDWKDSNIEE
ncbi:PA2169 family four-helix-bundle protein [Sphingobacterium yanglingense]|uniref:Uncharacterized protein (TIGR02284 family) n=1 Tax=Sphingobacterium yanglingense TaxID=1437280 RepID=A0A4R6WID1_9SPHI|nr:PA2169 family four-helix-bundle protein [Sphingobacterium yanglingense]TDQ80030.1 uncharacterized protein (TIGR02284 family) [Sphingobacterium yanglingense]